MENLKLTRIDFRLIHGQVMTRWVKEYNIKDIVVIDDKSAKSPILKKILLNAAPSSVNVFVESIASATEKWKQNDFPKNNLLILFKDTKTAAKAWKDGIKYTSLQIGGIEGSGNKKISIKILSCQKRMFRTWFRYTKVGCEFTDNRFPKIRSMHLKIF